MGGWTGTNSEAFNNQENFYNFSINARGDVAKVGISF